MMRRLLPALAAALAAACGDSNGPVAGELVVQFTGPAPARAAMLRVVGPATGVAAPSGSGVQVSVATLGGDTAQVILIAAAGQTLPSGAVLTLTVPDVNAAATYSAAVLQVSSATYSLLPASQYSVIVARP